MILGINHVGIVVKSIDETMDVLSRAFGAVELSRKTIPERGQTSCIVRLGTGMLELMEPYGDIGVVPKFLAEKGPGLHHISLLSDDVDTECTAAAEKGIRILGTPENPDRVVFTHPKTTCGVLYELTDKPFSLEVE